MKKRRHHYDLDDKKRRIVQEYLAGIIPADDLARREGLVRGQIYKWRVQLERRERMARIETIAETEGVSIEQVRRIRELEEELAATQQKLEQTLIDKRGSVYFYGGSGMDRNRLTLSGLSRSI
ncbi:MAG: hypothetical protein FD165_850 [Gammaproteobacteria bacterium]|nr:MAG: hypothetical protein FD165_850 [Gammaproteobacteria bacterium]TND06441.1 MAG: hypothetical protein FD120_928 [Gammaproteobacteria bacterium]